MRWNVHLYWLVQVNSSAPLPTSQYFSGCFRNCSPPEGYRHAVDRRAAYLKRVLRAMNPLAARSDTRRAAAARGPGTLIH